MPGNVSSKLEQEVAVKVDKLNETDYILVHYLVLHVTSFNYIKQSIKLGLAYCIQY